MKQRIRRMLGFKQFDNAVITISGIELAEKIKKGQFKTGKLVPGDDDGTVERGTRSFSSNPLSLNMRSLTDLTLGMNLHQSPNHRATTPLARNTRDARKRVDAEIRLFL